MQPASPPPSAASSEAHSGGRHSGAAQAGNPAAASPSNAAPSNAAQATPGTNPEFLKTADEVLQQMSKLLDLPVKEPLKKSLRSKQEIRSLLIQEDKEDKDTAQRYADDKSLEAFGMIPKSFPLDQFMLDVLTDQIAGMYDPKTNEFYIANWMPVDQQREVMAHELTHALEDQSFHIDPWIKAARPNDDAELARDAVSEGTATAAMVEYLLRVEEGSHMGIRDAPDLSSVILGSALSSMADDPKLSGAPLFIRDALLFPYLNGLSFSQQFLKAHNGWGDLHLLFENPPASTQQIIHPHLYFEGRKPVPVKLPEWKKIAPREWKLLEENVMGEFGLQEWLDQWGDQESSAAVSPDWAGDRYAVFEDQKTHALPLVLLLDLSESPDADWESDSGGGAQARSGSRVVGRTFHAMAAAIEKQFPQHEDLFEQAAFLEFHTSEGGVFLRCMETPQPSAGGTMQSPAPAAPGSRPSAAEGECLEVARASRSVFDQINSVLGWPPAPVRRLLANAERVRGRALISARQPDSVGRSLHKKCVPEAPGTETQFPRLFSLTAPGRSSTLSL